ncbi:MAG: hypothetical protein U9R06_03795 [Patescibacteria group bacterium]|nr:hypothetical protein [Patescibacteria group bacterium]
MPKKDVSVLISAAGWLGGFIDELVLALREQGITDEEIHAFVKREGKASVKKIAEILAGDMPESAGQTAFLRRISDKPLIIDAVDGAETLANATDEFAWIDGDFKNRGADEPGQKTSKTKTEVYEMAEDGIYAQIFGSLNSDVSKFCLTQHQIKNFVKKHRSWLLTDGYGTFFLFQSKDNFFVASVWVIPGGLGVVVDWFGFSDVWLAGDRLRLVVPQLA